MRALVARDRQQHTIRTCGASVERGGGRGWVADVPAGEPTLAADQWVLPQREGGEQVSPESQRIAIAEACGFVAETATVLVWADPTIREGAATGGLPAQSQILYSKDGHWFRLENLPSYLSDLNASHEMEKGLTIHEYAAYEIELCKSVDATGLDSDIWHYVLCATAAQRAEAFLRALGKWKQD